MPKKYKKFALSANSLYLCIQLKMINQLKKEKNLLVEAIVQGMQDKKGRNIVVVDLSEIPDTI